MLASKYNSLFYYCFKLVHIAFQAHKFFPDKIPIYFQIPKWSIYIPTYIVLHGSNVNKSYSLFPTLDVSSCLEVCRFYFYVEQGFSFENAVGPMIP
jgi:hypothetical protein